MRNWIDSICDMIKEVTFYLCWLVGAIGIVSIFAFLIYREQSTTESRLAEQIKVVIGQRFEEHEGEIVKLLIENYDPAHDNLIPDGDAMTLDDILAELKVDKSIIEKKVVEKVTEKKEENKDGKKEGW